MKKADALRVQFGGGETAILFQNSDECPFGTLIDENDNCLGGVFVILPIAQRVSAGCECTLVRLGSSGSAEPNKIFSVSECSVAFRETSFIIPDTISQRPKGLWRFGKYFYRTCKQFLYGY